MAQSEAKAALITGANSGIGKEVARQFAEPRPVRHRLLGMSKRRESASGEIRARTCDRENASSLTVPMDTADSGSVRSAIRWIDQPLHAVVMNAGGTGGATPMALTKDGATEIFASNVLGHVVLLEQLIDLGALTNTAVLTGSEAARGVPKLRIKRPAFSDHSVDEFACVIDGSFFAGGKVDPSLAYSQVKYLGALWMSALARQYPELRLVTMSPGNTAGTKVFSDMPWLMRTLMDGVLMPYVLPALRLSHTVDVGAKRLVDATVDYTFRSGVFYASAASTLTGQVVDQAGIITDFDDPTIQDHANQAIHRGDVPDRTS